MSEYDGLNLPQLLDRLHGLVMPEPVSWLPATPGWWVLMAWLLAGSLLSAIRYRQYRQMNRYRQDALRALQAIDPQTSPTAAEQIAAILKRTALSAFPRERVASLHGADWADFLNETSGNDPVVRSAAADIARAAYDPSVEPAVLLPAAERWIRKHRD